MCSPQAFLMTSSHLPVSLGTGSLYTPVSVVHIFPARSGHCLTPDHSLSDWSSLFRKYNSCNILHGIYLLSFSIGSTTPLTGILRRKFARCFPRSFSSVSTFELKNFHIFHSNSKQCAKSAKISSKFCAEFASARIQIPFLASLTPITADSFHLLTANSRH